MAKNNFIARFGTAFLLIASIMSCAKKELPEAINGNPVFMFDGTIGDDPIVYKAGVNGVYMYSDFFKDAQDLYSLSGTFAVENCATCEPFLSFEFKDGCQTSGASLTSGIQFFFADPIFNSYSLDSIPYQSSVESFKFIPNLVVPGASYLWDFGDGTNSSLASPEHVFTTLGVKNITLKSSYQGAVDSLTIPIDVTPFSTCRTRFSYSFNSSNNEVYVQSDNLSFSSYAWDFGNGTFGEGAKDTVIYNLPEVYTIRLQSSIGGCASEYLQKVNLTNNPNATLVNFNYLTSAIFTTNYQQRLNAGACIITYRKNGQTYQSYKNAIGVNQSDRDVFKVTGIGMYLRNEKDQPTVFVNGEVDTYLYNTNNYLDSIAIKSHALKIALAYPE
jgi:hypothetical protein